MEGFLAGSNEIEVFGEVNGAYKSCGSLTEVVYGVTYTMGNNVLFRTALAVPLSGYVYKLKAYEDDDDRCVLKQNDDHLGNFDSGLPLSLYPNEYRTDAPSYAWLRHVSRP